MSNSLPPFVLHASLPITEACNAAPPLAPECRPSPTLMLPASRKCPAQMPPRPPFPAAPLQVGLTLEQLQAMNPQLDPSVVFTEDVQMCDGGATYSSGGGCGRSHFVCGVLWYGGSELLPQGRCGRHVHLPPVRSAAGLSFKRFAAGQKLPCVDPPERSCLLSDGGADSIHVDRLLPWPGWVTTSFRPSPACSFPAIRRWPQADGNGSGQGPGLPLRNCFLHRRRPAPPARRGLTTQSHTPSRQV